SDRSGIWDRESGKLMYWLHEERGYYNILVSPCGPQVASARYGGVVKLLNVDTGQCVLTINRDSGDGWNWLVNFSLDGTRLLTACTAAVRVWNPRTGVLERELTGHDHPIDRAISSPVGGRELATFSQQDLTVRLWDMSTGQCTATFVTPHVVTMVAYSSDGSRITVHYHETPLIQAWDTATGKGLPAIDTGCMNHLLFSSDGHLFVGYSGTPWEEGVQEGTLQVWDTIKGRRVWTLGKTVGYIVAAVSHDSQFLVSSSRDEGGVIRLWDLKTGQQIGKTDTYRGRHESLALDMTIAAGGANSRGGGEEELAMTVGSNYGEISVWKLVARERPIPKDSTVERTSDGAAIPGIHSDSNDVDKRASDRWYEFVMQWTTAYGRLNAAGAKIEGVRGLGRVNARLLKQHGADGEAIAPLKFHQAVTKVMDSKSVLNRLWSRQGIKDEPVMSLTAADVDKPVGEEKGEGGEDVREMNRCADSVTQSNGMSLRLVQTLLDDVREQNTNDTAIKLVLCNYVDALLVHMKYAVKRPSITNQNNEDGNQALREGIATAYLDHAELVADLGHTELALNSRRRADKWG
ncbi:hypothetical protein BGZ83_002846, partial [Gryganskiella cystojenkinii]